ncbi:MAG: hypothetical protein EOP45_16635 [Sphingobacteriaceae bacterium]|nr:MAG: hypothetical protein EOP45_16635 [Sphingobacteriaceae bacterium]
MDEKMIRAIKSPQSNSSNNLNKFTNAANRVSEAMSILVESIAEGNNADKKPHSNLDEIGYAIGQKAVEETNKPQPSISNTILNAAKGFFGLFKYSAEPAQESEILPKVEQQFDPLHKPATEIKDISELSVKDRIELFDKKHDVPNGTSVSPGFTPTNSMNQKINPGHEI